MNRKDNYAGSSAAAIILAAVVIGSFGSLLYWASKLKRAPIAGVPTERIVADLLER